MTIKTHGAIIYYPADGGPVRRVVTAWDVAAMERSIALAHQRIETFLSAASADQHTLIDGVVYAATPTIVGVMQRLCYERDTAQNDVAAMEAERDALRSAYRVASAIMRSQPVGVPERLAREWREAQQAVEKVEGVTE